MPSAAVMRATVAELSSAGTWLAASRQAAGTRNAVHCASLRTAATGTPRAMSASAAGPATPLAAVEPVMTPLGGLLVFHAAPGQYLQAGELIAEVIDPLNDRVTPLRNTQAGLLYARSIRRMATAGMVVAHVAGEQVCRSGYLLGN